MRTAGRGGMLLFAAGVWLACGDDYSDDSKTGDRFNPCYPNGTCNAGLVCADSICILPGDDGGTAEAGSSGGEAGADSAKPTGLAALAKAYCAREQRCTPAYFAAAYADMAECEAFAAKITFYPGATFSESELSACAQALSTNDECGPYLINRACSKAGTLKDGDPCNVPNQCAGGRCAPTDADTGCGHCEAAKPIGGDCSSGPAECAVGLRCDAASKKCTRPGEKGESCSSNSPCASGLACRGEKCVVPGSTGASCTGATLAQDCLPGFTCRDSKCAEPEWSKLGQDCNPANSPYCARGNCVDAKCVPFVATGGDCSSAGCDGFTDVCRAGTCHRIEVCD